MTQFKLCLSLYILTAAGTSCCWAESYIPKNDDTVLLKLDQQQVLLIEQVFSSESEAQALNLAAKLLSTANQLGNTHQYQLAESVLAPYVAQTKNLELRYLWAQIKQHQHLFAAANNQLLQIFQTQPNHAAARLMASRLALIQRDPNAAKKHCQSLLGHTDVITTQICLLEVSSYQDDLDSSYAELLAIVERWSVPESHQIWVTLMLVDMAMRNHDFNAADHHLKQYPNFDDINYLATWSDVKLAMQQAQTVQNRLHIQAKSNSKLEDGLVLRLALAEQQINLQNDQNNDHWMGQLEQRIEMLAQREEFMHANEMARYFLTLNPNKKQALYWAERNWQSSKEHQDELLLSQARSFLLGNNQ